MTSLVQRTGLLALLVFVPALGTGCDLGSAANAETDAAVGVTATEKAGAPRTAMRVRVQTAAEGSAMGINDVTGVTGAFRTATVAAEVSGRVVRRHVEPGQFVEEGEPLIELDAVQARIAVDEARANVAARQADLDEAKRQSERGDALRSKNTISEQTHDGMRFGQQRAASALAAADAGLRRAERALRDAVIRAPFEGTVEEVSVQTGDYMNPGTPVATLADFRKVRIRAGVTATEADTVTPGQRAKVSVDALGGLERDVEVRSVGKLADPATGTYPVELWLDNEDGRLRAGMVAQLRFAAPDGAPTGPLVPRGALVRRNGKLVAFVIEGHGEAQRAVLRPVRVGRKVGEHVEILGGIQAGDRVVIDGLFALRDGAAVVIDGDPA